MKTNVEKKWPATLHSKQPLVSAIQISITAFKNVQRRRKLLHINAHLTDANQEQQK